MVTLKTFKKFTKIIVSTLDDHKKVVTLLSSLPEPVHLYTHPEERTKTKKWVVRGLPVDLDPIVILTDVQKLTGMRGLQLSTLRTGRFGESSGPSAKEADTTSPTSRQPTSRPTRRKARLMC